MLIVESLLRWMTWDTLKAPKYINFLQRQHERPSLGSEERGHGPGEGARGGQGRIMTILTLIKTSLQSSSLTQDLLKTRE